MHQIFQNMPYYFEADTNNSNAWALYRAIAVLDNGHFQELQEQLTAMLTEIFKDVPYDKDGYKILGNVMYHKTGIASDKKGQYRDILMPPFEIEDAKVSDADDIAKRIKLMHVMAHRISGMSFAEKQLKYAITGKKPTVRNGCVGKCLFKIQQIVNAIEASDEEYTPMFVDMYEKLEKECNPISSQMHHTNYSIHEYANRGFLVRSAYLYGTAYLPGEIVSSAADAILTGAMTNMRMHNILSKSLSGRLERIKFVPLNVLFNSPPGSQGWRGDIFETDEYIASILKCIKNTPASDEIPNIPRMKQKSVYSIICHDKQRYMEAYAKDLLVNKLNILETVYDAIQAYHMYDSIEDKGVREFLYQAGYLMKDWDPDDDLWIRASVLYPACTEYEYKETALNVQIECERTACEYFVRQAGEMKTIVSDKKNKMERQAKPDPHAHM